MFKPGGGVWAMVGYAKIEASAASRARFFTGVPQNSLLRSVYDILYHLKQLVIVLLEHVADLHRDRRAILGHRSREGRQLRSRQHPSNGRIE